MGATRAPPDKALGECLGAARRWATTCLISASEPGSDPALTFRRLRAMAFASSLLRANATPLPGLPLRVPQASWGATISSSQSAPRNAAQPWYPQRKRTFGWVTRSSEAWGSRRRRRASESAMEGRMRYFDDDGNEVNPNLIAKPSLCVSCAKDDDPEEVVLCALNRLGQRGRRRFQVRRIRPQEGIGKPRIEASQQYISIPTSSPRSSTMAARAPLLPTGWQRGSGGSTNALTSPSIRPVSPKGNWPRAIIVARNPRSPLCAVSRTCRAAWRLERVRGLISMLASCRNRNPVTLLILRMRPCTAWTTC